MGKSKREQQVRFGLHIWARNSFLKQKVIHEDDNVQVVYAVPKKKRRRLE